MSKRKVLGDERKADRDRDRERPWRRFPRRPRRRISAAIAMAAATAATVVRAVRAYDDVAIESKHHGRKLAHAVRCSAAQDLPRSRVRMRRKIDYKGFQAFAAYVSERGKIVPSRITRRFRQEAA